MFESAVRTSFQNEVPDYWARLSKECKPFNLSIPVERNWKTAKKRVLIVLEHVSTEDLKNKALLSGASLTVLNNCYNYAESIAEPYGIEEKDVAFAAINFNFFKNYHLDPDDRVKSHSTAAKRVRAFIEKCDPTHVLLMGDNATKFLLTHKVENSVKKMGWLHTVEIGGKKRHVVCTTDYADALAPPKSFDDDDDFDNEVAHKAAYVLGYFCRNICTLIHGGLPWAIDVKVKAHLIDSIKKFDRMMELVEAADLVAFDTETSNLNRIKNKLLIVQFSIDKDKGFVIPILHKDTPFSPKEIAYIQKRLRAFFMRKVEMNYKKYLIAFNAKFDITVVKQALGIPFMYWPVYDVQAGEHAHDETLRFLEDTEYPMGGLAQVTCAYGNDFYYTAGFSKKDRGNMEATDLFDQDFQDYCAMDTQAIFALHDAQRLRAKNLIYRDKGRTLSYYKDHIRVSLGQMSNNIHVFASMEHRGVAMDRKYLSYLKTRESPISKAIQEITDNLNSTEAAQKANKLLLADMNVPVGKGLFNKQPRIFDINKPAHKIMMYVDVLGLEPELSKKTKKPSLGKIFKKKYEEVVEVALLNTLEKAKKIKSSYVDAFAKKIDSDDGKTDGRMRASYGFFKVLSGRSNSSDPSLQQVPQRGEMAKHIKRTFAPPPFHLIIKMDYSAHEVRVWSIISGDTVLGGVFAVGRKLRQKWAKTGLAKYAIELGNKGDIHRINVNFFFGVDFSKITDDMRDAVKGVAFGVIYGKSFKTLAKDLKKSADFAKDLYDRFFKRFVVASNWLTWTAEFGRKNLFAKSAIGRRRHLFGHLTGDKGLAGAMDRRAKNSPIQGMGADFGHTGARLFEQNIYEYLLKIKRLTEEDTHCPVGIEVMVHDSIFTSAPIDLVLASAQILQWCATLGMQAYYDKHFDLKFTVPCEIEMEFGASQDKMYKWDWSLKGYDEEIHGPKGPFKGKAFSLDECIKRALKDHCALYPQVDYDKAYAQVYRDWNNSKLKAYLDEHYPILADYEA